MWKLPGRIIYLAVLIVIGVVASRRMKGLRDYFVGGKAMGYWSVAFSARATGESAWLLLGLTGMAYSSADRSLLVADPGNRRVQLYSLGPVDAETPAFDLSLGRFVKGMRLPDPVECGPIARHGDGSFDLLDLHAREIRRYDADWKLVTTFGGWELVNPIDIEWDPVANRLLVSDAIAQDRWDNPAGRVLSFPGGGHEPSALVEDLPSPAGIGVSSDGGFYVSDLLEHRVLHQFLIDPLGQVESAQLQDFHRLDHLRRLNQSLLDSEILA